MGVNHTCEPGGLVVVSDTGSPQHSTVGVGVLRVARRTRERQCCVSCGTAGRQECRDSGT
jgi:hypothetical protein